MIGTDIEFGVKHPITGNQMNARSLFIDEHRNYIIDVHSAPVGLDGHNEILELRPSASETIYGLTRNLKKLLRKVAKTGLFITAGAFSSNHHKDPIGLHIHFSYPPIKKAKGMGKLLKAAEKYISTVHYDGIYRPFDDLASALRLALVFVGLICHNVEGSEGWLRRNWRTHSDFGPYGKLTDFRKKTYGLEYRAPACLAESKSTFLSLLDISNAINKWLTVNLSNTRDFTLECIKKARRLNSLSHYKVTDLPRIPEGILDNIKHGKLLDLALNHESINFHVDLRKNWNIPKKKLSTSKLRELLSETLSTTNSRALRTYGLSRDFEFKNGKYKRFPSLNKPNKTNIGEINIVSTLLY